MVQFLSIIFFLGFLQFLLGFFESSRFLCHPVQLLCVQWKTPDDGQRNCPKHVEFHSKKKKIEKSVHVVGSFIRNSAACLNNV